MHNNKNTQKQQELQLVLNTHWNDLTETEKAVEKLSNGPIWRCYKTVVVDQTVSYDHYLEHFYNHIIPDSKGFTRYE